MKHMRYRCEGCSAELTVGVSHRVNAIIMFGLLLFMAIGILGQLLSDLRLVPLVFLPYMLWIGFSIWLRYRYGRIQNKPRRWFLFPTSKNNR